MKNHTRERMRHPSLLSLRPVAGAEPGTLAFSVAGKFSEHYSSGAWRPLCAVGNDESASERLLFGAGLRVALGDPHVGGRPEAMQLLLPEAVSTAYTPSGSAKAVLMYDGGVGLLDSAAGSAVLGSACTDFPTLRLVGAARGRLTVDVGPRALRGDYAAASALSAADAASVGGDLADAYRRLQALADEADVMLQPALVGYRLLDAGGAVLHSSPPLLLMAPSGPQCSDAVEISSPDRVRLDPYTLSAESWCPELLIPDDAAAHARWADVAAVEIVACPQFHPDVDSAAGATIGMGRGSSEPFLRVALPGRAKALGRRWSSRSQSNVARDAGRFESVCRRVALVTSPVAGASYAAGAATESAPLSAAAAVADEGLAELLPPHSFSARVCAADSATVLWADVTRRRFEGYPLEAFATARPAAADAPTGVWHAAVEVDFADGSRVVRSSDGRGDAPVLVGPLLSYPSPEARRMTISLTVGGRVYRRVFDLVPDASGRRAICVEPSIMPFTPTATDSPFAPGQARGGSRRFPDALLLASPSSPLAPFRAMRSRCGRISTLAAAPGANQAWEFGSRRFYVGGEGGLLSLTLRADGRAALKLLDRRSLTRPDALCSAAGIVYALLGADIVRIESGRVVTLMPSPLLGACALCYSAARRELTLFASGSAEALTLAMDCSMMAFRRPLPGPFAAAFECCGRQYALCGDVLCRTDSEAQQKAMEVEYAAELTAAGGFRAAPGLLRADFSASGAQGTLRLTAAGGAEMLCARFAGAMPRGLSLRWPPSRRMARLGVRLTASVTPDFCLHDIVFTLSNKAL